MHLPKVLGLLPSGQIDIHLLFKESTFSPSPQFNKGAASHILVSKLKTCVVSQRDIHSVPESFSFLP